MIGLAQLIESAFLRVRLLAYKANITFNKRRAWTVPFVCTSSKK